MHTINTVTIDSDLDTVFHLATDVAHWPEILPHYRWVTVSKDERGQMITEMAAWRDCVPVWWRSIQWIDETNRIITYRHIAGATRGMEVEWSVQPDGQLVKATILHLWDPSWPLPGIIRNTMGKLAGELFIKFVADRTLRGIKQQAELLRPATTLQVGEKHGTT
jgi:ribosome-associated toxin RatA of RatAB toxin-antitoxin module